MTTSGLTDRVAQLRDLQLFSGLDDEALALVASVAREVTAPAGRILAEPKQAGAGMYVITDGHATAELRGGATRELGSGDCFGELALLTSEGERTARVYAETPLHCLAIARDDFLLLLEREPKIAVALLQVLATRLAG